LRNTFLEAFYLHRLHIEQSIPRPTDNKRREKIFYSGKKKRYAVKTQIMVNNRGGFIIHKTDHKKGSRGMTMIFIENHPVTPKQVVNVFDLGYLGVEKDFPTQLSALLYRKKKSIGLVQEEKEYNLPHAKKRIVIEHTPLVD